MLYHLLSSYHYKWIQNVVLLIAKKSHSTQYQTRTFLSKEPEALTRKLMRTEKIFVKRTITTLKNSMNGRRLPTAVIHLIIIRRKLPKVCGGLRTRRLVNGILFVDSGFVLLKSMPWKCFSFYILLY